MAVMNSDLDTGAPSKILVLGLDMGDGPLIQEWVKQGKLPNFADAMLNGSWWELESPAAMLHTSTWPTFATGVQPGCHGVYYPFQPRPGYQQAQHVDSDQYGAPTFWALADQRDRRCIVYDLPETFLEQGFKGRAVFEWGTWARYGQRLSQPKSLIDDLKSRFGPYPLKLEATRLGLKFPNPAKLERRLIKSIEHKVESLKWLLGQDDWDLAVVGLCETHPTGHYLWPADYRADSESDSSRLAAVQNVYTAVDKALGTIRHSLPADTIIMIASGDGVRPNHCGWHLLPEVMEKLGYAVPPAQIPAVASKPLSLKAIKTAVPPGARRWIADHLPYWLREKINARVDSGGLDWSKTKAFTLPTDLEGYIRINLAGREPEGIVEPGAEYESLCREIAARLEKLVNPTTGRPAVNKVEIRDEIFPGSAREHLPDLIVSWNGDAPISMISSPEIGTIEQRSPDPRTGTHSPAAFLLATGPGIQIGGRSVGRLVDVAPTVLALLGVELASAMDGEPLARVTAGAGEGVSVAGEGEVRSANVKTEEDR